MSTGHASAEPMRLYMLVNAKPMRLYMLVNDAGNGSTIFHLPDMRGEFVRSADHGRGVDTGRGVGTWQGQEIQRHSHRIHHFAKGGYVEPWNAGNGQDFHMNHSGSTQDAGGAETRPRNMALTACIKC